MRRLAALVVVVALEINQQAHADLLTTLSAMESRDTARGVHTTVVRTWADLDDAPQTVAGAYLRLHTLSHRLVRPNTVNLDGIFSRLPNVVWTSMGPCSPEAPAPLPWLRFRPMKRSNR